MVSFDFDGTLTESMVQAYAQMLVKRGMDVYICTFRHDDTYSQPAPFVKNNNDLYNIADKVGILRENIIFTNYQDKGEVLMNQPFIWHLDDDLYQLESIAKNTMIAAVHFSRDNDNWMSHCERLLK